MSIYDIIDHEMQCPHCGIKQIFDIDVRFQNADLNSYILRDNIIEHPKRFLKKSNFHIDGYAQCENEGCKRDFFVLAENKTIVAIEIDLSIPVSSKWMLERGKKKK